MIGLNENNIIKENIKDFRMLITESVNQNDIIDAIKNRKVIYIFYAGDATIQKGYSTIESYLIGFTTAGNIMFKSIPASGRKR